MMWRSKYFWIALAVGIPFIVVWVKYGFFWAIGLLIALGIIFFMLFAQHRRRRRYYYYDDDDYDEEIIVERGQRRPSSFNRAMDWHVPKVSRKGSEFITGASGLRKHQRDAMRRTKKNLWG